MENASKALMIAGAILIAVALISIFMYVFSAIGEFNGQTQAQQYSNQVNAANRFFVESSNDINSSRSGVQIYGYDAYNIIRKAEDINDNPDSPVSINLNIPSELRVDGDRDDILTSEEKDILNKQFDYSYKMDNAGYVNVINISSFSGGV